MIDAPRGRTLNLMGALVAIWRIGAWLAAVYRARRGFVTISRTASLAFAPRRFRPRLVMIRRTGYRLAYRVLAAYWLVVRPHLKGVKCVIVSGEHVLLVRHTYGPRGWDLPGGGFKRGEPPAMAAEREMEEELGLRIRNWTSLGTVLTDGHRRQDTLHCFQATLPATKVARDPVEIAAVRWCRVDDLPRHLNRFVRPVLAQMRDSA